MLPPQATIAIPPAIQGDAKAVAAEDPMPHPAWQRIKQQGRHLFLKTTSLEDIEELADWARTSLIEPEQPLDKAQRAAFKNVLERAGRWAHLEHLGPCHCLATGWKQQKRKQRS